MHLRKYIAVIGAALAVAMSGNVAQAEPSGNANKKLVGVWQVLRHGVDCDSGQQLGDFSLGRKDWDWSDRGE